MRPRSSALCDPPAARPFPQRASERGAILLKAVLLLSLLVVAGILSFLAMTTMRYQAAFHRAARLQARLWSESGIQDAMNRIRHDPFWRADGTESFPVLAKIFDDGEYEVLATTAISPNHVSIVSAGRSSWAKHEARQDLFLDIPSLFALIAYENVCLSGNSVVEGAISSGENVIVAGDASISGAVQVRQNFNGPTRVVSGPIHENFFSVLRPAFDITPYLSGGYVRLFGGPISNVNYADTTLLISGSSEITGLQITNGTLLVEGDLRVTGPCRIEAPTGRMALIVTGNLTVEDRGVLLIQGPVYVYRDFKSRGKTLAEGTIMAQNIEIGSEARVRPRLEDVYGPVTGLERFVFRGSFREGI